MLTEYQLQVLARLEHEISDEGKALGETKRNTILSLGALAALVGLALRLIEQHLALRSVSSVLLALLAGALLLFAGLLALNLARFLSTHEFKPFAILSGYGPFWFSFPLHTTVWILVYLSSPEIISGRDWYLLAIGIEIVFFLIFVPLAKWFFSFIQPEIVVRIYEDKTRAAPAVGKVIALSVIAVSELAKLFLLVQLLGRWSNSLSAEYPVVQLAGIFAVSFSTLVYLARQVDAYDVQTVCFLRGLRIAYVRAGFPAELADRELNDIITNNVPLKEFKQSNRSMVSQALSSRIERVAKFYTTAWSKVGSQERQDG